MFLVIIKLPQNFPVAVAILFSATKCEKQFKNEDKQILTVEELVINQEK